MRPFKIHIAGEPTMDGQKCARCGVVLVDTRGLRSLNGIPAGCWSVGSFVGTAAGASVLMGRDARDFDEVACGTTKQ